jgi:hypothetical protein
MTQISRKKKRLEASGGSLGAKYFDEKRLAKNVWSRELYHKNVVKINLS